MASNRCDLTSPDVLKSQYRDATNLNARSAIYRFGQNPTPWPRR